MSDSFDRSTLPYRKTCFEIHIRPMMRLIDHDHMLFRAPAGHTMDLFSYDDVKSHAAGILERLQYNMPTISYGGLWPAEWIQLFQRWMDEGYPRLELYSATYTVVRDGDFVVLTSSAQTVRKRDRIWLERFSTSDSPREYYVYREPGDGDPNVTTMNAIERFPKVSGVNIVVVNDVGGRKELPIP